MSPNKNQSQSRPVSRIAPRPPPQVPQPSPAKRRGSRKARGRRRVKGNLNANGTRYLTSLMFPENIRSRIPDVCSIPTSMVSATFDYTMTANVNGVCGTRVLLYAHAASTVVANEDPATTTDAAFTYLGNANLPSATAFNGAFTGSRLVSASLQVEFTGTTLNDQGTVSAALTAGTLGYSETGPTSISALWSSRDNSRYPAREGLYVRWKPVDDTNDDFHAATTNLFVGGFIVHLNGLVASTATFRCRLTCNYEAIPSTDTFNFQEVESSPIDPQSYQEVREIISGVNSMSNWWDASNYTSVQGAGARLATLAVLGMVNQVPRRRQLAPAFNVDAVD